MANEVKRVQVSAQAPGVARVDVLALAQTIYAGCVSVQGRGRTPDHLAAESISLARAFSRAWDESSRQQPVGLDAPAPQG